MREEFRKLWEEYTEVYIRINGHYPSDHLEGFWKWLIIGEI